MHSKNALLTGFAIALLAVQAMAQPQMMPANPTPGCSVAPAQLEANKNVALEFVRTRGPARVALADPSYRQHNPEFKKRAEENKVSDYEEFKSAFLSPTNRPGGPGSQGVGALPPQGNPMEIVTAECDIVTIVHKLYRQDPTAEPGKFYEAFTFDTFRVRNGKLVEHWDDDAIRPPRPAARPGQ